MTESIENVLVTKIVVSSGLEKPYYIKNKGMSSSGCYMRLGTSTQPMPTALIDELYAKRIHTTLRNIPSPRQDLTFVQLEENTINGDINDDERKILSILRIKPDITAKQMNLRRPV